LLDDLWFMHGVIVEHSAISYNSRSVYVVEWLPLQLQGVMLGEFWWLETAGYLRRSSCKMALRAAAPPERHATS
jgi:hypothetical protein